MEAVSAFPVFFFLNSTCKHEKTALKIHASFVLCIICFEILLRCKIFPSEDIFYATKYYFPKSSWDWGNFCMVALLSQCTSLSTSRYIENISLCSTWAYSLGPFDAFFNRRLYSTCLLYRFVCCYNARTHVTCAHCTI